MGQMNEHTGKPEWIIPLYIQHVLVHSLVKKLFSVLIIHWENETTTLKLFTNKCI